MALAEGSAERSLTDAECEAFLAGPCPAEIEIPDDVAIRGGLDSYGTGEGQTLRGTTVRISGSDWGDDEGVLRRAGGVH